MPANGSIVAALETTLQNTTGDGLICDKYMTGKPNPNIIDMIRKNHGIDEADLSKFIMVGDNPSTDIALANNAGIDSLLVLTGCTKGEEEAKEWCF